METSRDNAQPEQGKSGYTAESITVLKGLEAVRKRPAMYIGDIGERGLHHLVYEVVDNSIDEALAGHCNHIIVIMHADGSVSVLDNGRGIPVDMHPEEKRPAVEVVLTMLHAGGKFDKKSYKVSGGLHGVGVSAVNALSEWLEVKVKRNGNIYTQRYERGIPVTPVKTVGQTQETGTEVRFKPDNEIFTTLTYQYDILLNRVRELAFLNRGLRIDISEEATGKKQEFMFEGGIKEFVCYLNKGKKPLHGDVIFLTKEESNIQIELAMQYNDGYQENVFSFANNINTPEGGTHLIGFKTALTRVINSRFEKKNGKKICIYGASTRGNVILQYFDLDAKLVDCIADKNSDKHGKKTVGSMIPIVSPEKMREKNPDYLLVMTWHFFEEIKKQENGLFERGVKFIVPLPAFKVISKN